MAATAAWRCSPVIEVRQSSAVAAMGSSYRRHGCGDTIAATCGIMAP